MIRLSRRLTAAASLVRPGSRLADIGTDHAYLPVSLLERDVCPFAVAADINAGPLERASRTVAESGVGDRCALLLTDGLCGVEAYAPDDVVIAGMGGELIARIISEAPWTRSRALRLILQPMSRSEALREWLWENGYSILCERLVTDDRLYEIFCVQWTGKRLPYTAAELLCGKLVPAGTPEERRTILEKRAAQLQRRIEGLRAAGKTAFPEEQALLEALRAIQYSWEDTDENHGDGKAN